MSLIPPPLKDEFKKYRYRSLWNTRRWPTFKSFRWFKLISWIKKLYSPINLSDSTQILYDRSYCNKWRWGNNSQKYTRKNCLGEPSPFQSLQDVDSIHSSPLKWDEMILTTLPETNIAPENGSLEGIPSCQVRTVSFREGRCLHQNMCKTILSTNLHPPFKLLKSTFHMIPPTTTNPNKVPRLEKKQNLDEKMDPCSTKAPKKWFMIVFSPLILMNGTWLNLQHIKRSSTPWV